jgi:hypothetical protein
MISVDRIEGTRAVLDVDGEMIEMPLSALPAGVHEGAVLTFHATEADPAVAEARLARLRAGTKQGGGNFQL